MSFLQDAASELLHPILPIFLTVTLGAPVAVEGAAEGDAALTKLAAGHVADRSKRPLITLGHGLAAVGKLILALAGRGRSCCGEVSGFGITATFAASAVTTDRLIILGNWPNGLDVTPPTGTIVKTFGLQECNTNGTACTSELGNFPNSPAGIQRLRGQQIDYTAGHPLPDVAGNTNFGTNTNKLVTITANTGANRVYVYNANNPTTATAYPKLLGSTSDGSTLTFQTFQPIVWVETAPTH